MDVMSKLLKDRILLLGQEVNDEVGNVLVAQLLYLANDDPDKDITLYINSPGGSVSAGLAIYDTMQVRNKRSPIVLLSIPFEPTTAVSKTRHLLEVGSCDGKC